MSIPFDPKELEIKRCARSFNPNVPGTALFDFPVSEREALLSLYNKKEAVWMPYGVETSLFCPSVIPDNKAREDRFLQPVLSPGDVRRLCQRPVRDQPQDPRLIRKKTHLPGGRLCRPLFLSAGSRHGRRNAAKNAAGNIHCTSLSGKDPAGFVRLLRGLSSGFQYNSKQRVYVLKYKK